MASPSEVAPGPPPPSREVSVFVHPLPRGYSAADLRQAAHQAGIRTITDAWIPRRQSGQPYGYLRFGSRDDAVAALDALQQLDVATKPSAMLGHPKLRRPKMSRDGPAAPAGGAPASVFGMCQADPLASWCDGGWEFALSPWTGEPSGDHGGLLYPPTDYVATCLDGSAAADLTDTDSPSIYMPLLGAAGYPAADHPLVVRPRV